MAELPFPGAIRVKDTLGREGWACPGSVGDLLALGFTRVDEPAGPAPVEDRAANVLRLAREDIRRVTRDDLVAVARMMAVDPPDRANKSEILALIEGVDG